MDNNEIEKQPVSSTPEASGTKKPKDDDNDDEHAEEKEAQIKESIPAETKINSDWSVEKLNKEFRKFNIDLHPRVRNLEISKFICFAKVS